MTETIHWSGAGDEPACGGDARANAVTLTTNYQQVTCPECQDRCVLCRDDPGHRACVGEDVPLASGSFEAALDFALDEVRAVMIDRHKKYGPGNILRHGLMGVVVRLGDKYERLDNNRDEDFADESVDDTILDIVGYGLIARLLRAKAWPGQGD